MPPIVAAAYRLAYGRWRGSAPVLVDTHPNPQAHAIIAAEVVRSIRNAN